MEPSHQAYQLELMTLSDFEFLYELVKSTMERDVIAAWGEWCDEIVRSQLLDGLNNNVFSGIFIDSSKERLRKRSRVGAIAVERHETHIQIEDLYILEEFQNQGIGTSIIQSLIQEARQNCIPVCLRVLSSSPARFLYERLGFVIVKTTPQRYFMEFI